MSFHPASNQGYFNPNWKSPNGGSGRWLVSDRFSSNQTVFTYFDLSLITAANYSGSGNWTVEPRTLVSGLSSFVSVSVAWNPDMSCFFSFGVTGAYRVWDFREGSGTFATIIDTGNITGISNLNHVIYHVGLKMFILSGSTASSPFYNRLWQYKKPTYEPIGDFSIDKNFSRVAVNQYNGDIYATGGGLDTTAIYRINKFGKSKCFGLLDGDIGFPAFDKNDPNIIYGNSLANNSRYSAIRAANVNDLKNNDLDLLSSISMTNRSGHSNNTFYHSRKTSYWQYQFTMTEFDVKNTSSISIASTHTKSNPTGDGNYIKLMVCEPYNLLVAHSGSSNYYMHFFDISTNLTYIGYRVMNAGNNRGSSSQINSIFS